MPGWRKYFNSYNAGLPPNVENSKSGGGYSASASSYESWLPQVYAGSPNRLMRYIQYDQMDQDLEVNAALDIIAEFCTQQDDYTGLPFYIDYYEDPSETESKILSKALEQWVNINEFNKRIFRLVRNTIKYGDQILIRDPETYKLYWTDIANVDKVVVNESEGKDIELYFIKNLEANFQELTLTSSSALHSRPYGGGQGLNSAYNTVGPTVSNYVPQAGQTGGQEGIPVDAVHCVHISLTEGMDHSWPFGVSILEPVFKIFKQKELLEDSIIIYRVHRAPERRVFFIDVGDMPPQRAQQYLERVKYEVQQKRVPNKGKNGQNVVDAAYNPMSMLEDYFFAQTADGRGSKVDTLPGGENLGQIDDLKYFNNKLLRGLRVPSSYLPTGPDDGSQPYNDGKVGVAYIQEYQFSTYCKRIQRQIIDPLDLEFKKFLKNKGIEIDSSVFSLRFTEPQNFSSYRELELDSARASLFSQLEGTPYMSKRFMLKKYLGLTEEEIKDNEYLWKEENKYNESGIEGSEYGLRNMGVRAASDEEVDLDAPVDDLDLGPEDTETPEVGADTTATNLGEPGEV